MKRFAVIAMLLAGTPLLAQKAPEMHPILAGKKVEQAFKGTADVDFTSSSRKEGDIVVTTMKIKNNSAGPIGRLKVEETWFDKSQNPVASSASTLDKMIEPGAVETLTIQTPWSAKMNGNSWQFSHANGTVKPHKVTKLDSAPAAGAKATAKKK